MDEAHIQTDKMIDDLKKELDTHYSKAADEVRKKTDDFFQKYQAQDIEKQADLQSGKLSKEEYQSWQKGKIFTGKRWEDMQDTLAKDLAATDQIAADIINNKKCDAYALNHNYGTYEIEHQTGISTSFTLYDHDTVERLIAEKPEILPKNKVNIPKDQAWNKQLLRNAVTQGVLQGESIPKIAKRMQSVTDMDKNSAIRNSRTAMTGAQNAGRVDSYKRAQDLGIDVTQQWMSTLDARTRNSHRLLMGEKRKVGEKFSNGLRFPGDPEGPGYEVYNCRCTLVAKVDGYGPDVLKDTEEKITKNGETFEQWQKGHSFSKRYDETVKQWMARYAEHLKKQSFEDWMKEQTKPQVEAKPQAEKIHPNAQASLDNIKFEKSKPKSGKIQDAELDKIFEKKYGATQTQQSKPVAQPKMAPSTSTTTSKAPDVISIDKSKLKNKKVTEVYNELKDKDPSNANKFYYTELKKIAKSSGKKPGDVWQDYLDGKLDDANTKKIDACLKKTYGTTQTFDKSKLPKSMALMDDDTFNDVLDALHKDGLSSNDYQKWLKGKIESKSLDNYFGITQQQQQSQIQQTKTHGTTYYKDKLEKYVADFDDEIFNQFTNEYNHSGYYTTLNPQEYYEKWKSGEISNKNLDNIFHDELQAIKKSEESKSQPQTKPQVDQKALDAAKQELDKAKQDFEDAKKKFPKNKTYSGIWKDDVTLENYEAKKDKIAAKKQYFQDEINSYESHMDDLEPWQMQKLASFYEHIQELDEFEKLGQEYSKAKNDLAPLEKKVKDAQDKVTKLSPVDEAYTQERKDNAKWFTKSQYSKGDKYYDALARPVHAQATSAEHSAYMEYTDASGGFNRPLAGFEAPKYSGADGWNEKHYKGAGNVPLNNEGKGKKIKDLTTFVAKAKTQDDIWVQTAQNFATLEGKNGFLGVPYGSLQSMSDAELQQFVGVQNTLGQFISGSINRGGGGYTPGNMRINIYLPRGSEALYVLEDGTFGKMEHEIILQRGGTYRVSKIYWGEDAERGGKKLMVDLELRLELGYNKYGQ